MKNRAGSSSRLLKPFSRPQFDVSRTKTPTGAKCLPDLVLHNALHNPEHIFCLQQFDDGSNDGEKYLHVTFQELARAVESCASRLCSLDSNIRPAIIDQDGIVTKSKPVALFLESGVNLFIHIVALLTLNVPCLLLSTRLSPAAASHILDRTGSRVIIASQRTQKTAQLWASENSDAPKQTIIQAIGYEDLMRGPKRANVELSRLRTCSSAVREDDREVLILHSSGSTGLPKPIRLAHRYLLGYAACHLFPPEEDVSRRGLNLSTLPFFHGFGLLAPCLALSVGKSVCLPPPSRIPSADLMLDMVQKLPVTSIMTVPSLLEDLINMDCFESDVKDLVNLDFITVGGGAIKPNVGAVLHDRGVKILNHFGATELGALSPIFRPDSNYDWHYLRLRQDLGLELNPVDTPSSSGRQAKLIGYPFAWDSVFELQDKLIVNPEHPQTEIRIVGREDDLIVLGNGEKIMPHRMESILEQHPAVKRAIVFGSGHAEVGVLIEPLADCGLSKTELVTSLWPTVLEANEIVDQHACVMSQKAIIIKSADKQIPLSDKGVAQRQQTYEIFKDEIEAVYDELENDSDLSSVEIREDNLEEALRSMVQQCLPSHVPEGSWADSDDFFNIGMDSLRASRLRRLLSVALQKTDGTTNLKPSLANGFIYNHPSVEQLSKALKSPTLSESDNLKNIAEKMRQMSSKYAFENRLSDGDTCDNVVLITGATGHLGCNLVKTLCENPSIRRVICLARSIAGAKSGTEKDASMKQKSALAQNGITISEESLRKVVYYSHRPGTDSLSLAPDALQDILQNVTHVFHGAWPMDFKQQLPSFEIQVKTLKEILQLGRKAHQIRPHIRPRIILASSIAAVGRYPYEFKDSIVPEKIFEEPEVAIHSGYGQAKWVCEKLMQSAFTALASEVQPMIIRIGQLAGSRTTGYWNPKEHMPALMRVSKTIGGLPNLEGTISWLPIDEAALSISEILLEPKELNLVYHLENPTRQSWESVCTVAEEKYGLKAGRIQFDAWLKKAGSIDSNIANLEEFFKDDFLRLSSGSLVLSTEASQSVSRTLRSLSGVGKRTLEMYLDD